MAKKKKAPAKKTGNKSQEIRDYKKSNPAATDKEIADKLGCSYNLVYQALNKKAKGKGKGKGTKRAATRSHASNGAATQLVQEALGLGIDKAIEVLQRIKAAIK